jgi:hypothetical protein
VFFVNIFNFPRQRRVHRFRRRTAPFPNALAPAEERLN